MPCLLPMSTIRTELQVRKQETRSLNYRNKYETDFTGAGMGGWEREKQCLLSRADRDWLPGPFLPSSHPCLRPQRRFTAAISGPALSLAAANPAVTCPLTLPLPDRLHDLLRKPAPAQRLAQINLPALTPARQRMNCGGRGEKRKQYDCAGRFKEQPKGRSPAPPSAVYPRLALLPRIPFPHGSRGQRSRERARARAQTEERHCGSRSPLPSARG